MFFIAAIFRHIPEALGNLIIIIILYCHVNYAGLKISNNGNRYYRDGTLKLYRKPQFSSCN